ncbi:hypothetical protein JCM10207_006557 [Rhodosporidiobolus poonsookiae]
MSTITEDPAHTTHTSQFDPRVRDSHSATLSAPSARAGTTQAPTAAQMNAINGVVEASEGDALEDWAPGPPTFEKLPASGMPHLPKASGVHVLGAPKKPAKGSTSKPFNIPLTPLQASISYSLARLLSLPRFAAFLQTPLGFAQFHAYLTQQSQVPPSASLAELEAYKDLRVLASMLKQAGLAAKGINDVYLSDDAAAHVDLPRPALVELLDALRTATAGAPGLDMPTKHLLHSLYTREFEGFVRHRLLKHTKAQLQQYHLSPENRGGIGSAFLLTNPRLPDDPIVLVSPAFTELTGYTAQQIIGRNCRFLQGRATAPSSVDSIRKRLEAGEEITQLVINYRASGEPFLNMVDIIPLRDLSGRLTYFLGGQTDVSHAMTTGTDLSFILPEDESLATDMAAFSPAVQVEAREAGQRPADPSGKGAGLEIREAPPEEVKDEAGDGGGEAKKEKEKKEDKHKKEKDVGVRQLGAFKKALVTRFSKGKKEGGGEQHQQELGDEGEPNQLVRGERLVPATLQDPKTMPLERRVEAVQNTYERLCVVRRANREILFTTAGFLRFLGLPGTSKHEVDASPLVHRDLLELVVSPEAPSPASVPTRELRGRVKQAIAEAQELSLQCGVQLRLESGSGGKTELTPFVTGRIHLAPLLDLYGESSAVTCVFG